MSTMWTQDEVSKARKADRCRRNWSSAKAIESFLAINCLLEWKKKGLDVKTTIMDDATKTLTRAG